MFNFNYILTFYMIFMVFFMIFYFYKHLLMMLISLEFLLVFSVLNMFYILIELGGYFYIIFLLIMSVCEGALGLSLIVLMVRFYGNDYIWSLNMLKW